MKEEQTELLAMLLSMDEKRFLKQNKISKGFWQYEAMVKRERYCLTVKIDKRVLFFLMFIEGAIGKCIMYLYQIQYIAKNKDIKFFSLKDFCEAFGNGFPYSEDLSKIWDACKVDLGDRSGNLIDYSSATMSIQFEKKQK